MLAIADVILILIWIRLTVLCALGIRSKRFKEGTGGYASAHVSMVVPAFNEERHIERTLTSLLEQEHQPWEIIVVDDGSTDRTAQVARRCLGACARAQVIELPRNAGKAAALNVGVRAASGDLVATIDADTRLDSAALGSALETMTGRQADAVAFYLDVDNPTGLLAQLQRQEYVASLNFERSGQDVIGAISILPGAATLFRRELLVAHPFSARSWTEDADLTLSLARRGMRFVVSAGAVAATVVPGTWAELVAQRTRWIAGHLQCCALHCTGRGGSRFFRAITLPNFVLSTLMVVGGAMALVAILVAGRTPILRLEWLDAVTISCAIVYAQRGSAWLLAGQRRARLRHFLLEPILTNLIGTACFFTAVCSLLQRPTHSERASRHRSGNAARGLALSARNRRRPSTRVRPRIQPPQMRSPAHADQQRAPKSDDAV